MGSGYAHSIIITNVYGYTIYRFPIILGLNVTGWLYYFFCHRRIFGYNFAYSLSMLAGFNLLFE